MFSIKYIYYSKVIEITYGMTKYFSIYKGTIYHTILRQIQHCVPIISKNNPIVALIEKMLG